MPISINISTDNALKAGALWRVSSVDGNESVWFKSGEIADHLREPIYYKVEFKLLPGWKTPDSLMVRNVIGVINTKEVEYRPLPVYELDDVPPQIARHGKSLEFMINTGDTKNIEIQGEPAPAGNLVFEAESGRFFYEPASDDKFPFFVTMASSGIETMIHDFEVTPMPRLPQEVSVFHTSPIPPIKESIVMKMEDVSQPASSKNSMQLSSEAGDSVESPDKFEMSPPESSDSEEFVIIPPSFLDEKPEIPRSRVVSNWFGASFSESTNLVIDEDYKNQLKSTLEDDDSPIIEIVKNEKKEKFNNLKRETRDITIIGENVIFEEGLEAYDTIHKMQDIKHLEIFAKTVIIRDSLHLPQTTVNIYASQLRFEDHDESKPYLETTPVDYSHSAKGESADGENGAKAGDIILNIEYLHVPDNSKRFILKGGKGQEPGHGDDGDPGKNRTAFKKIRGIHEKEFKKKIAEWPRWPEDKRDKDWKIVWGHSSIKRKIYKKRNHYWFPSKDDKKWPTDGKDAKPDGMPGKGGAGGNLLATIDVDANLYDVSGGNKIEGKKEEYKGGRFGTPQYSIMFKCKSILKTRHRFSYSLLEHEKKRLCETKAGRNASNPDGKKGEKGTCGITGHPPLSWLHHRFLSHVLERAREAHLECDIEGARAMVTEYAELLDIYLEQYRGEGDDNVRLNLELSRIRNEIRLLLSSLDGNLDYFGKPAGWVPMLSFEVSLSVFDKEIDSAIELLYMTYWLQRKAEDTEQRVAALNKLQEKLKEENEDLIEKYETTVKLIPQMKSESSMIAQKIDSLQSDLMGIEEDLRRKAESKLETPWWKTGLKVLGKICNAIPVLQPALGAVGGTMNLVADFDKEKPWETIKGAGNVFTTVVESKVEEKTADFNKACNRNKAEVEFDALKKAKKLQSNVTAIGDSVSGIYNAISDCKVPKSEVDSLLDKLRNESKEFEKIASEISELGEEKERLADRILDAMQLLNEIPNDIYSNLLAIDSASDAAARGRHALRDGRLAQHLSAIERKARDRLLKYHYYVSKSYEYRLLECYNGPIDIEEVFDEMETLAALNIDNNTPMELTKEQFTSLKALYKNALSQIAEKIIESYNQNRPELSSPRDFDLTQNEIARLNSGKSIVINPVDLGLVAMNEENVRIEKIEVDGLPVVTIEGDDERRMARLLLNFKHSGISRLRQSDRTIQFRHFATKEENPIGWAATYDPYDEKLTAVEPSAASNSLLRSLLNNATASDVMIYSRPGAWADIVIKRDDEAMGSTKINLKELRMTISCDFMKKSKKFSILNIKAKTKSPESENLAAYFKINTPDNFERQDGRGEFYRYYLGVNNISVEAQSNYGRWYFKQWMDAKTKKDLGNNPQIEIKLDRDIKIRAVYALRDEIL
ncbi:MAG: hypothetical protein GY854_01050 [Deltaproteobacteria bacterium]|nr:hypothetical protein [Deltaproteobacteria bacterium]